METVLWNFDKAGIIKTGEAEILQWAIFKAENL